MLRLLGNSDLGIPAARAALPSIDLTAVVAALGKLCGYLTQRLGRIISGELLCQLE
jgi:hypothetical protein